MKKAPILRCRGTIRWKPRRRRLIPRLLSVDPGGFFAASFPSLLILFAGLLGIAGADVKANSTERRPVTPINLDLYHTSIRLIGEVNDLVRQHPDKFSMETIKAGNKGYQSEVSIVTYCHGRKEVDDNSKFRILLSFGQHGRELITTELALRILSILSEEESLDDVKSDSLNSFLDKLVIKVVPMENLNGRKLVEGGDICERRNGRGVDLNRNWSVDWGKKEKDYDPYEENPGVAPFSEPESQIMRKLATSFNPHMWVNVHSGMEALFMPYDHKNTTPPGLYSVKMKSLLKDVNHLHFHNRCMIGSGGGSVGYLAHGTATDYMYDVVRVPMAFTFEIYGDWDASSGDCFKMFNPIDIDTYNRVINDWSAAFFTIFKIAPKYMDEVSSQVSVSNANSIAKPKKWETIDDYLQGYLMGGNSPYGKKLEVLDLGMQEIRTYYRLFLLSFVLLMFMFCSRISKNKSLRNSMSSLSLSSFTRESS